jgi:hypothetical protein
VRAEFNSKANSWTLKPIRTNQMTMPAFM